MGQHFAHLWTFHSIRMNLHESSELKVDSISNQKECSEKDLEEEDTEVCTALNLPSERIL